MPNLNSWNMVASNRIVAERQERDKHERHLHQLNTIRPSIDNRPPAQHPHLRAKLKTKKLQEDRAAEIQLENRILLQKMLNIDTKPSSLSGETLQRERVLPKSLHGGAQRRELDRITKANREMLKRLQSAAPSVDPRQWEVEEEERQALKFRLSQNAYRYQRVNLRMPNRPGFSPSRTDEGEENDEWERFADEELNRQLEEFKLSAHHHSAPQEKK
jgi:hypothetical protein